MAHFAEIDEQGVVVRVLVVSDEDADQGPSFLTHTLGLGGTWVQTSYNSHGGVHYVSGSRTPSGKPHLRFNYASPGYTYDADRDAFIPPKPGPNAVLDEATCLWLNSPENEIDSTIPADLTE